MVILVLLNNFNCSCLLCLLQTILQFANKPNTQWGLNNFDCSCRCVGKMHLHTTVHMAYIVLGSTSSVMLYGRDLFHEFMHQLLKGRLSAIPLLIPEDRGLPLSPYTKPSKQC